MALTLAEAKELSQNKLTGEVIDEFRKSALLDMLVFDNTIKPQGGTTLAYSYNRVETMPTAAARAINTEYVPQETKSKQITVNLKIFGGAFELDRAIMDNEKQAVDHVKHQLTQKIQATRALFHDAFINGDSGVDANLFDGINKAVAGSSTETIPAETIDLSSSAKIEANWKELLYLLRRSRAKLSTAPTLYMMNADMFAVFQTVMDRAGVNLASKENYGDEVLKWGSSLIMQFGDKPGTSKPIIANSEISGKEGETDIYFADLSLHGVHGVSPDGSDVIKQYLPNKNDPGAVKKGEVEMIAAVAIKATRSCGVIRRIKVV